MTYLFASFGFVMLASAFASSFLEPSFTLILMIVSLFGFLGFCTFGKKFRDAAALFSAAFFGFLLVFINLATEYYPSKALDGLSAPISGTVTEISSSGGNPVYTVETDYIGIEGAPQKIKILLSGWGENPAAAFDKISCEVTFHVYSRESTADFLKNRSGGISVNAYADSSVKITGREDSSFGYRIHLLREKISSIIYKYFIDWHAAFSEQLLIGTRGELESEISDAFRKSGMSHILAISGMHMVIIVELFEKIFRVILRKKGLRKAKYILMIAVISIYMVIGGLGMSVLRSGFMLISHYISKLFFSGSKSLDNLGIAVAAVLLIDPLASCDIGFLMSVSSCCAIYIFAPPFKTKISELLHAKGKHIADFFIEAFCVSSVAFLAVLPISAFVFGEISLVSPLSNLFAGFFAQYSIIFSLLTVILGFVPFLGFFAGGTAFIAMLCNSALLKIAEFFAGFSFAYIEANDLWFFIWIIGCALLIIIPALYSKSFRYLKHSFVMSVFVLIAGILLDFIFFSGVSEIKITALEHGTAISCSNGKTSVLIAEGLDSGDRYNLDFKGSDYDAVISSGALSGSAEYAIVKASDPETALLSTADSISAFENAKEIYYGKIPVSEEEYVEIIPGAFCFETNGVTLLYIFGECDIMEAEPKFRRADIVILDGVSPEDFPVLRCDYLILRKMGGYYSGTNEIITLRTGELSFFAYDGNIRKGGAVG